jgi:hypothetical protein
MFSSGWSWDAERAPETRWDRLPDSDASTYITNFLNISSPGRSPQWGHQRGSARPPLDGAAQGLKAKFAFFPCDFDLLSDDLFSMSWHTFLLHVLSKSSGQWGTSLLWALCHLAPMGLAASFGVGTYCLQRPSIRAGCDARHPILYASFDESRKHCRRRPHLSDGFFERPGSTTGRLHQHQG